MPKFGLLTKSKAMGSPEGFRAGEEHRQACFGVAHHRGRASGVQHQEGRESRNYHYH